jgi:hypothetical protein
MALPKTRRQGVTWNVGADSKEVSEVMVACGGERQAVLGASMGLVLDGEGATILGESCKFTLGLAGTGGWFGRRDEGANKAMIQ